MRRYCDIVMKGGITSGVVYPLAAVELARRHRFRNIGGTSAGAIAAAAVAAAELGRRSGRNEAAYEEIERLPGWLGENMTSLFQPSRRTAPLFNTLLAAVSGGPAGKLLAPLNGFPLAAIAGLLPAAAFLAAAILLDAGTAMRVVAVAVGVLVLAPAGVFAAIAASVAWRLRGLPDRGYYGICSGNDRGGAGGNPPLTRWLADFLDELAGTGGGEGPLTFGDLWRLEEPDGERGIDLQMMTTCLSQGRPYSLPFEGGEALWFDPDELRDLFPERIVDHMVAAAPPGAGNGALLPLPPPERMPVVVAARMSLSFPLLIGAVPLYAENHAWRDGPRLERCWFSDGGITSNFPIHFFDAPVPRWPTYAINLVPIAPDRALQDDERENVWLPETNDQGVAEAWVGWEDRGAYGQLGAFLASIFRTAQNWIDNRQTRGPGHRDRIAHVRLTKEEGGMNLTMDGATIERLATRGACAANRLSERFEPEPPPGTELTWANQRWIRYRAYMRLVEQQGLQALRGFEDEESGAPVSALNARPLGEPPGHGWASEAQRSFAIAATEGLLDQFEAWREQNGDGGGQTFAAGAPEPPVMPWQIPRV